MGQTQPLQSQPQWHQTQRSKLRQLLLDCYNANNNAVMACLDESPGLINESWNFDLIDLGDGKWIQPRDSSIMCAVLGGNEELVIELANRGCDRLCDALWLAAREGLVGIVKLLLDRGCDPNTRTSYSTALGIAVQNAHVEVSLLLISRGADLMALVHRNRTALDYIGGASSFSSSSGTLYYERRLTTVEVEQRRDELLRAFELGLHQRNLRWARRWPFMQTMACHDFQPLAARRLLLLKLNPPLPTDAALAPINIENASQRKAHLNRMVFGHPGFWRLIASYL